MSKKALTQNEILMKPDFEQASGLRYGVYDKLNKKGYVPEETIVNNGDVIIGKVTHPYHPLKVLTKNVVQITNLSNQVLLIVFKLIFIIMKVMKSKK